MTRCAFNEAEALLAVHLQELSLHFQQHYRYVPGRKFEADFAVWRNKPAEWQDEPPPFYRFALIEVQGGVYSKQAHGSVTGILKDDERLYWAFRSGWGVLRFTPDQVMDGTAKTMIAAALGREP